MQVPRKGPIKVATDYPLVAELLTSPAFAVTDRADEASADVLIALRPVRDFYALPRSVAVYASTFSQHPKAWTEAQSSWHREDTERMASRLPWGDKRPVPHTMQSNTPCAVFAACKQSVPCMTWLMVLDGPCGVTAAASW